MSVMMGCQGKEKTPTLKEKICPNCGEIIEIFSTDTEVACDHCGTVVYNDALSCVQWCQYAKDCVGEEAYDALMEVANAQKARRQEEREARLAKLAETEKAAS